MEQLAAEDREHPFRVGGVYLIRLRYRISTQNAGQSRTDLPILSANMYTEIRPEIRPLAHISIGQERRYNLHRHLRWRNHLEPASCWQTRSTRREDRKSRR